MNYYQESPRYQPELADKAADYPELPEAQRKARSTPRIQDVTAKWLEREATERLRTAFYRGLKL